jgi:hypothetical protein
MPSERRAVAIYVQRHCHLGPEDPPLSRSLLRFIGHPADGFPSLSRRLRPSTECGHRGREHEAEFPENSQLSSDEDEDGDESEDNPDPNVGRGPQVVLPNAHARQMEAARFPGRGRRAKYHEVQGKVRSMPEA